MGTEPELPVAATHTTQTQHRRLLDRRKTTLITTTPAHKGAKSRQKRSARVDREFENEQNTFDTVPKLHQGCSRQQQLLLTLIVLFTLSNLAQVATQCQHYPNPALYASSPFLLHDPQQHPADHRSHRVRLLAEHLPQQERPVNPEWHRHAPNNATSTAPGCTSSSYTDRGTKSDPASQRYPRTTYPISICCHYSQHITSNFAHTNTTQCETTQQCSYKPPHKEGMPYKTDHQLTQTTRHPKHTKPLRSTSHTHNNSRINLKLKTHRTPFQQPHTIQNHTLLNSERVTLPVQQPPPSCRRIQKIHLETPPHRIHRLPATAITAHHRSKLAHHTDCTTKNTNSQ